MSEEERLEERELTECGPLIEAASQVVVPKRGKLFMTEEEAKRPEDVGTCKAAIIRPCISRGKRIRGLPPIYTPRMLAEHADVFTNWPMFMDHLSEDLAEELTGLLEARGRSIRDLGGRVVRSWWDPELKLAEDEERGFEPGGVVARVLPQPPIRAMLEADPELLHLSIAAWPTGAKAGEHRGARGYVIEGIRRTPPGSVDWVLRGGAGGRPLEEAERLAVSVVESFYAPATVTPPKPLSEMSLTELREHLREVNPTLSEQLNAPAAPAAPQGGLTMEALQEALDTQREELEEAFDAKLEERDELAEQRANELVRERDQARANEKVAQTMIREAAGLTPGFRSQLLERFTVHSDGNDLLLAESDTDEQGKEVPAADVFRTRVQEHIDGAVALINESRGGPAVRGQGRSAPAAPADGKSSEPVNPFREFMLEGGGFEKPEDVDKIMEEA